MLACIAKYNSRNSINPTAIGNVETTQYVDNPVLAAVKIVEDGACGRDIEQITDVTPRRSNKYTAKETSKQGCFLRVGARDMIA